MASPVGTLILVIAGGMIEPKAVVVAVVALCTISLLFCSVPLITITSMVAPKPCVCFTSNTLHLGLCSLKGSFTSNEDQLMLTHKERRRGDERKAVAVFVGDRRGARAEPCFERC